MFDRSWQCFCNSCQECKSSVPLPWTMQRFLWSVCSSVRSYQSWLALFCLWRRPSYGEVALPTKNELLIARWIAQQNRRWMHTLFENRPMHARKHNAIHFNWTTGHQSPLFLLPLLLTQFNLRDKNKQTNKQTNKQASKQTQINWCGLLATCFIGFVAMVSGSVQSRGWPWQPWGEYHFQSGDQVLYTPYTSLLLCNFCTGYCYSMKKEVVLRVAVM
jgi:hypothetical protein